MKTNIPENIGAMMLFICSDVRNKCPESFLHNIPILLGSRSNLKPVLTSIARRWGGVSDSVWCQIKHVKSKCPVHNPTEGIKLSSKEDNRRNMNTKHVEQKPWWSPFNMTHTNKQKHFLEAAFHQS